MDARNPIAAAEGIDIQCPATGAPVILAVRFGKTWAKIDEDGLDFYADEGQPIGQDTIDETRAWCATINGRRVHSIDQADDVFQAADVDLAELPW